MVREVPLIIVYNGGLYLDFLPTRARYTADYTPSISAFFLLIMQDYTCGIEFIMAKQVIYTTQEVAKRLLTTLDMIEAAVMDGANCLAKTSWDKTRYDQVGINQWVEVPMTDSE
jgi:hypothetical protein